MVLSVSSFFAKRMELHLSLAISSSSSSASSCSSTFDPHYNINYTHEHLNKRKHGDYDDDNDQTMPFLVCGNFCCNKSHLINEEHQDHDHDGHGDDEVQSNYVFVHRRNEYDGGVIGWLPMKSCTKNLCHPKMGNKDGVIGWPPVKLCRKKPCHRKMGTEDGGGGGRSKSTYYKVHMEGIEIARKVNLNLHQSYHTLVPTLANMFGKCFEDVKLTYQDQEGDWLLAEDVPWGLFINTVQRLKLRRK